ncbi:MAG: xylulokinase [Halanaerobium sp.]
MSNIYSMGIDIGTSGCKTILINEKGEKVAATVESYPVSHPKSNWSEQNPEDWWNGVINTIKELINKVDIDINDIVGIGLTGQMHGLVALDENNEVLRPAILWNDQRTSKQVEDILSLMGGRNNLIKNTNNNMLTGYTAPKILWFRQNEPDLYDKTKIILNPKDYIRFKLTGDFATDVSDASGTGMFNVKERDWSKEVLNTLSIPMEILPEVYESVEITGTLKKSVSDMLGLKPIKVAAGGGDAVVQTTGTGLIEKDILGTTIGTAGIVSLGLSEFEYNESGKLQFFCNNEDNRWHIMGVNLSSGGAYEWYKNNLCRYEQKIADENDEDVFKILDKEVNSIDPGAKDLLFLPYLIGERCPYPNPNAKGAFIGLTLRHTHADLTRAVQEGIIYNLRHVKDLIASLDSDIEISEIRTSGGGSMSEEWKQIQADIFQLPVKTIVGSGEGAAFGAAIIAGVACDIWNDLEEAVSLLKVETVTTPNSQNASKYNELYNVYVKLHDSLENVFEQLGDIDS